MTDQGGEAGRSEPLDVVDEVRRLAALRDRDELTEEEFQQAKARVVLDGTRVLPPS
jgi:hypothetical protein